MYRINNCTLPSTLKPHCNICDCINWLMRWNEKRLIVLRQTVIEATNPSAMAIDSVIVVALAVHAINHIYDTILLTHRRISAATSKQTQTHSHRVLYQVFDWHNYLIFFIFYYFAVAVCKWMTLFISSSLSLSVPLTFNDQLAWAVTNCYYIVVLKRFNGITSAQIHTRELDIYIDTF